MDEKDKWVEAKGGCFILIDSIIKGQRT